MSLSSPSIRLIRPQEGLPFDVGASIFELANSIWPPEGEARSLLETLAEWKAQHSIHCVIQQENSGAVLAHSLIFKREIKTSQGILPVGALATVCVHPDYRGYGWGADIVSSAFRVMPELGAEVSLFQTGVPQFYEKLGGRLVDNRFYNGQTPEDPGNPFWDVYTMIYPGTYPWPDGDIDLNGKGY